MTMYRSVWFLCVLVFIVVDTRIGALPPADDIEPLECHICNSTSCSQPQAIKCPKDKKYCATIATAPNYTNLLSCSGGQDSTCILQHEAEQFQLTCICDDNLCNAPYNQRLRNELINFAKNFSAANSSAKLTEIFFKFSVYANTSDDSLYKKLITNTMFTTSSPAITSTVASKLSIKKNSTVHFNFTDEMLPSAEALKHEATVPPDDDEDENEGSGTSMDEGKNNDQASPAAPSSYLPANENNAQSILLNSLLIPFSFCFHSVM